MDLTSLKYPKKSHRKSISYPPDSTQLAEFMGIVLGDGGINNNWQLVISLNSLLDSEYSLYVASLVNNLFEINSSIRKRPNQNTLVVVTSSINFVDFLVMKGAVRGNKIKQGIDIPSWINENNLYARAFIRGIVDTDGCLYIHKHKVGGKYYFNLGFCFTSYSKNLILSVANILTAEGIKPHLTPNGHHIYLYRAQAVLKYLSIFGSSNSRILNKYRQWRDAGAV